jgi:hypothetical protein
MADKKISELTELTAPDGAEELVVNDSGVSKKITQANLFKLGDNVKAKFGAGDDLEIYHSTVGGEHSYIKETGTGNLRIQGSDITLQDSDGNGFISCNDTGTGGTIYLKHGGSNKLATTSTGVDVTGSVTCDGLISEVEDASNASVTNVLTLTHLTTGSPAVGMGVSTKFIVEDDPGTATIAAIEAIITGAGNGEERGDLVFKTLDTDGRSASSSEPTESMRIDRLGNVTVSDGNLVIGTSGKGIDFSAVSDGSRSVSSNILDDYEEGTWTPGITFGGTFDGTYDGQVGNYTKIGDLVTVSCFVDLGTKGTTTGAALLTGLPFTTNTTALTYSAPSFYINTVSFADMIVGFATYNGTTVIIREVTNAGSASNLDNTNFTDTSHVIMNLSYRV